MLTITIFAINWTTGTIERHLVTSYETTTNSLHKKRVHQIERDLHEWINRCAPYHGLSGCLQLKCFGNSSLIFFSASMPSSPLHLLSLNRLYQSLLLSPSFIENHKQYLLLPATRKIEATQSCLYSRSCSSPKHSSRNFPVLKQCQIKLSSALKIIAIFKRRNHLSKEKHFCSPEVITVFKLFVACKFLLSQVSFFGNEIRTKKTYVFT